MDSANLTLNDDRLGGSLRKQGGIVARSKRKAQDTLDLATLLGMLILSIVVMVSVAALVPDLPPNPSFIAAWNTRRFPDAYYQVAKHLIRPLILASLEKNSRQLSDFTTGRIEVGNKVCYVLSTVDTGLNDGSAVNQLSGTIERWSRVNLDPDTSCFEIGNGVWCAKGRVDTRLRNGLASHLSWSLYFVAETATPLFSEAGDIESGNLTEALRFAQVKTSMTAQANYWQP